jgi:hypothetical protein
VADRLLARAAELDSRQGSGAEIASLRAAAAEAGIRPEAFDAALAEMRAPRDRPIGLAAVPHNGRRSRKVVVGLCISIVVLIVGMLILRVTTRSVPPPDVTTPAAAPALPSPSNSP